MNDETNVSQGLDEALEKLALSLAERVNDERQWGKMKPAQRLALLKQLETTLDRIAAHQAQAAAQGMPMVAHDIQNTVDNIEAILDEWSVENLGLPPGNGGAGDLFGAVIKVQRADLARTPLEPWDLVCLDTLKRVITEVHNGR